MISPRCSILFTCVWEKENKIIACIVLVIIKCIFIFYFCYKSQFMYENDRNKGKKWEKKMSKYFWIQISCYNIEHMVVKFILLHKSSIFTSSWISLRRNSLFLLNIANYRNLIMIVNLLFSHQFFKNKKSFNFFHPISKIY